MSFRKIIDLVHGFLVEDAVFEMANLRERHTGLPGIMYVSTRQGRHGPRVKYFPTGTVSGPNFSMTIEDRPRVKAASGMSRREIEGVSRRVEQWVLLNKGELLRFWNDGNDWSPEEIADFASTLKRI